MISSISYAKIVMLFKTKIVIQMYILTLNFYTVINTQE